MYNKFNIINNYLICVWFSVLEIARAQNTSGKPESAYLDINSDKPIRLTSKIMVPAKEFPRVKTNNYYYTIDKLYLY